MIMNQGGRQFSRTGFELFKLLFLAHPHALHDLSDGKFKNLFLSGTQKIKNLISIYAKN